MEPQVIINRCFLDYFLSRIYDIRFGTVSTNTQKNQCRLKNEKEATHFLYTMRLRQYWIRRYDVVRIAKDGSCKTFSYIHA